MFTQVDRAEAELEKYLKEKSLILPKGRELTVGGPFGPSDGPYEFKFQIEGKSYTFRVYEDGRVEDKS